MKWFFPKNEGGRESGFHDAGVETFKGNIDQYLARELIQNSLDARYDPQKPVEVKFEMLELVQSDVPDLSSLRTAFERCVEYFPSDKKCTAFFRRAISLANGKTITALKVGDHNTTGVVGSDTDRKKDFYNLIRCAGSSSKPSDAGGSFGIGKNAPFAASMMRTVLYSTCNKDREHVFIGVSTLVSHDAAGVPRQPTGYLGEKAGASVRSKADIPPKFLRVKMGTDIYVLGFRNREGWQKDLVYSVLESFWPAIDLGELIVTVGNQKISSDNLADLLTHFSGEEEFNAHLYYQAYKAPSLSFQNELKHLRKVTLYLSSGANELPNRVGMIRKPGMVVFAKQFRSIVRFCGVFMCRNEVGNELLRNMEPPRHDVWDGNHPEPGDNKRIESEYTHFIRDCVKTLVPADDAKMIAVPGLSRFLPDDDESPEEAFEGGDGKKGESAERAPLPEKIEGRRIDPKRSTSGQIRSQDGGPDDSDEDDIDHDGDGLGGVILDHPPKKKPGQGAAQARPTIPIRYRTFATNVDAGVYSVTIQTEAKSVKAATLAIWTVGDDRKAPAEIESARLPNGIALPLKGLGQIGPVALPNQNGKLHFEVKLREPLRLAMEVVAHEAN